MKKYILKYTDRDGHIFYPISCSENGETYRFSECIENAKRYSGSNAIQNAKKHMARDMQDRLRDLRFYGGKHEIIEIEEDPSSNSEYYTEIRKLRNSTFIHKDFQEVLPKQIIEEELRYQREHNRNLSEITLDAFYLRFAFDFNGVNYIKAYYEFLKDKHDGGRKWRRLNNLSGTE